MIPAFNEDDPIHIGIVESTRALANDWLDLCDNSDIGRLLNPNSGSLNSRRRSQRRALQMLPSYGTYEEACRQLFE